MSGYRFSALAIHHLINCSIQLPIGVMSKEENNGGERGTHRKTESQSLCLERKRSKKDYSPYDDAARFHFVEAALSELSGGCSAAAPQRNRKERTERAELTDEFPPFEEIGRNKGLMWSGGVAGYKYGQRNDDRTRGEIFSNVTAIGVHIWHPLQQPPGINYYKK
eukprot:Gb_02459 [translate_table: standard]